MDKPTPGPWHCSDGPDGYQHRLTDIHTTGRVVCDVLLTKDARLIAAAPELLEALEYIAGLTGYANCDNCNEVSVAARAAIAKATGATP